MLEWRPFRAVSVPRIKGKESKCMLIRVVLFVQCRQTFAEIAVTLKRIPLTSHTSGIFFGFQVLFFSRLTNCNNRQTICGAVHEDRSGQCPLVIIWVGETGKGRIAVSCCCPVNVFEWGAELYYCLFAKEGILRVEPYPSGTLFLL